MANLNFIHCGTVVHCIWFVLNQRSSFVFGLCRFSVTQFLFCFLLLLLFTFSPLNRSFSHSFDGSCLFPCLRFDFSTFRFDWSSLYTLFLCSIFVSVMPRHQTVKSKLRCQLIIKCAPVLAHVELTKAHCTPWNNRCVFDGIHMHMFVCVGNSWQLLFNPF